MPDKYKEKHAVDVAARENDPNRYKALPGESLRTMKLRVGRHRQSQRHDYHARDLAARQEAFKADESHAYHRPGSYKK